MSKGSTKNNIVGDIIMKTNQFAGENTMGLYERDIKNFRNLNRIANKNGVVLFGTSFLKEIPVCELNQTYDLNCDIYNRSLIDLSVFSADKLLKDCVFDLSPKKILLQLGETDLEQGYHSIPEIIKAYEDIISKIKEKNKHCKIVIVSICENESGIYPEEFNCRLEAMAKRNKCQYADISSAVSNDMPFVKAFSLLSLFMVDKISLCDIISVANI